jgi:hypothetical protein
MQATRFVGLAYPRPALVDAKAPEPRRYYADLVTDLLRCSAPASRRLGAVRAAVARHGLARLPVSTVLALSPARQHPDMDRMLQDLTDAWQDLAAQSRQPPEAAPDLSLPCMRRSLGWLMRLGLRRWREPEVVAAFSAAWGSAPLFVQGRRTARAAAGAVGVPDPLAEDLEIAFYARRLQQRVHRSGVYLVGPRMTASMLATVCVS